MADENFKIANGKGKGVAASVASWVILIFTMAAAGFAAFGVVRFASNAGTAARAEAGFRMERRRRKAELGRDPSPEEEDDLRARWGKQRRNNKGGEK